ncbi:hypothetical protein NDU88_006592 [Pleurodeles waltl]|uniref:Uncharacterized protein n=1 Tax=Pleurodeles waltl TaxID=8319 RepID=A0AAV7LPL9_PLEWA|nr:hypothetical protein NDU88_006592 [Pleurodeles waltl]
MNLDFRVPGSVKVDDGLRDGEEENIKDATEDAKKEEEKTDARGTRGEGRAGNSDVPTERTGPVRKDSSEETHTHCHVPGGVWLNKGRGQRLKSLSWARVTGRVWIRTTRSLSARPWMSLGLRPEVSRQREPPDSGPASAAASASSPEAESGK